MAQIVADSLGVGIDDIVVLHGDTAMTQSGVGTFGSRSAAVGGGAMVMAVDQVKEKTVRIAAHLLEASPDDVELTDGRWAVRGAGERSVGLVEIAEIVVLHGDTAMTQSGVGTFGSRSAAVGGGAMVMAVDQVKEKTVRIAAHLLEASPDDVELTDGRWAVRGAGEKSVGLVEIAGAAYGGNVPAGDEPGLEATRFFKPADSVFPFGVHVAVVDVDRDTGRVKLRRFIAVDDVGNVINPLILDGQRHGGIVQGVAQALCEEVVYDENGQLVSGTLNDYALPTAHILPMFELDRTVTTPGSEEHTSEL